FRGRLLRWVFLDLLLHTLLDLLVYRLTGRSLFGDRQAIRAPARQDGRSSAKRGLRGWALRAILVLLVALIGTGLYGVFAPSAQVFGKTYSHARTGARQVALTFDDGPNEPYTSQVLDILKREDIRATFFLVGMNAERHPDTLARMLAEGHVVGNHTWSHRPQAALVPGGCYELVRGQAAITRLAGVQPALFRPPYGLKTPWWLACARSNNLVTVMWNVEAQDPHRPPASVIVERIVRGAHPGAVILLHDGDETRDNSDRSHTVEALPRIIAELRAKGYEFVTVPDLLGRAPYQRLEVRPHATLP
ncbi:MAG: polysaccharide deacetylase family protein, partial [Chloroflexi bacterium]|nr:polysaccharide deacetylase family protein [Chloroflexota bacterium]